MQLLRLFLSGWVLFNGLNSASLSANAATLADPGEQRTAWSISSLPGAQAGVALNVLKRTALVAPARYRVVVVPGSGCTGWAPVADRYFAGLLHAELLLLHKPGVAINAGLAPDCSPEFVARDTLASWRDHARAALQAHFKPTTVAPSTSSELPVLLVGISEGAELLPSLADSVSALAGVVMISAPGLDPRESGELQARRLGQWSAWQALEDAQASGESDDFLLEGRTLAYWRSFWHWPLAQPLLDGSWPLLRVWGDVDELVDEQAYQRFAQQARTRIAPLCDLRLPGANHGLQTALLAQRDGLQWLWARLENWARLPGESWCTP
jgi:hypothetical protein